MEILSTQVTYRSVRFHEIFDFRGNKENTWSCWWRLKEEVGRVSETERGKWQQHFLSDTKVPEDIRPCWTGATSTSPHQQRVRPEIETRTEIQHGQIICLYIIILSMFMKEHDNTSKPDIIPGYSRERDLPSTHVAPRKETWVPNLR